jgi:hypothetical protein
VSPFSFHPFIWDIVMKGDITTRLLRSDEGQNHSVALFVFDLDSEEEALEVKALLETAAQHLLQTKVRRSPHILDVK